jgi:hypothetical protein
VVVLDHVAEHDEHGEGEEPRHHLPRVHHCADTGRRRAGRWPPTAARGECVLPRDGAVDWSGVTQWPRGELGALTAEICLKKKMPRFAILTRAGSPGSCIDFSVLSRPDPDNTGLHLRLID